jgi:hypothetical protein
MPRQALRIQLDVAGAVVPHSKVFRNAISFPSEHTRIVFEAITTLLVRPYNAIDLEVTVNDRLIDLGFEVIDGLLVFEYD